MGDLGNPSLQLFTQIKGLIDRSRQRVAVTINVEITHLYYNIGRNIHQFLMKDGRAAY